MYDPPYLWTLGGSNICGLHTDAWDDDGLSDSQITTTWSEKLLTCQVMWPKRDSMANTLHYDFRLCDNTFTTYHLQTQCVGLPLVELPSRDANFRPLAHAWSCWEKTHNPESFQFACTYTRNRKTIGAFTNICPEWLTWEVQTLGSVYWGTAGWFVGRTCGSRRNHCLKRSGDGEG